MDSELNEEGILFDSVKYKSVEEVENLIQGLTVEQSFFFISKSLEFAHSRGAFNLTESELISKSLRILIKKVFDK